MRTPLDEGTRNRLSLLSVTKRWFLVEAASSLSAPDELALSCESSEKPARLRRYDGAEFRGLRPGDPMVRLDVGEHHLLLLGHDRPTGQNPPRVCHGRKPGNDRRTPSPRPSKDLQSDGLTSARRSSRSGVSSPEKPPSGLGKG